MNRKVKSLMVLKGIKSIDIARKLGVSHITVSIILTGKGKSRRIQKAIADALEKNMRTSGRRMERGITHPEPLLIEGKDNPP